jgi:hypothetical protein
MAIFFDELMIEFRQATLGQGEPSLKGGHPQTVFDSPSLTNIAGIERFI